MFFSIPTIPHGYSRRSSRILARSKIKKGRYSSLFVFRPNRHDSDKDRIRRLRFRHPEQLLCAFRTVRKFRQTERFSDAWSSRFHAGSVTVSRQDPTDRTVPIESGEPVLRIDLGFRAFQEHIADIPRHCIAWRIKDVPPVPTDTSPRFTPIGSVFGHASPSTRQSHGFSERIRVCSPGESMKTSWTDSPVARDASSGEACRYPRRSISRTSASCRA